MSSYVRNIWDGVYTVLVGMKITLRHLFAKKVTMQYPEKFDPIKERHIPENSRNRIFVDMDGCDGCNSCARVCPVNCITVDTVKVIPNDDAPDLHGGKKRRTWVTDYQIDFALCCFCSLCTEACPTEAIKMTQEFEYSGYTREGLIYQFSRLTPEEAKEKEKNYDDFQKEKKRKMAEKKKAEAEKKKEEEAKKKAEAEKPGDADAAKKPKKNKDDK